jgi:hypothetical protein
MLRQQFGNTLSVLFPLNCAPLATFHDLPLLSIGEGQRLVEHNGIAIDAIAARLAVLPSRLRRGKMNVVYAVAAYPAGVLSDHANRITVLGLGFGILVAADFVLAFTSGIAGVAVGVALWGLHMGLTQGLLATLVADTAPPELRGTAYGIFNLLVGLALLVASILAGALWDIVGSQATFLAGAAFTALALAGLAATRRIAPTVGQSPKSG